MATNFRVKIGEIGLLTFIHRIGIPKRSGISQLRFQTVQCNDLATSCKNLVNFDEVNLEFTRVKNVDPLVDQQFSYVRLAATLRRSVLSFLCGGGTISRP